MNKKKAKKKSIMKNESPKYPITNVNIKTMMQRIEEKCNTAIADIESEKYTYILKKQEPQSKEL